jgi:hypothetical protein
MNKIFLFFGVLIILVSCKQKGIDNPEISIQELKDHISFLASDSLKGRKPGTPEGKVAANYIENQFLSFGYKALGEKGFQYFDVITSVVAGPGNNLSSGEFIGKPETDFQPFSFSANATLEADVVFCGFGFDLNKDSLKWEDYNNVDVKGKWVMILRADPELDNEESRFIPYAKDRDKVLTAKDKGAAGVLLVSGEEYDPRDKLAKLELDQMGTNSGVPAFHISRTFANFILKSNGKTIEQLEKTLIEKKEPSSFDCNIMVKGTSDVEFKKVKTQNVIGFLEGTDPVLKEQIIVIGGHYDHLGFGGKNSGSRVPEEHAIHYGADDNASGTASVIEIAEKLAANHKNLRRSVIVIAFGAEELGLLGSKYFTNNPLVGMDKIVAMINVDMVGRLKETGELMVGGTGTSKEGEILLDVLAKDSGLKLAMSPNGFGPSDHASFYVEDIPVFFFSTGAHEDYHTPRDVVSMINFEGLKKLDDFIYELSLELINRDSTLVFQEAGPKQESGPRRRNGVRLGIMPSFTQTENNGLGVDGVTPGGPAALGGLLKGDRIVAIEGNPVTNIYDYMARMSKLEFGQTITVDIIRDGEKQVLLIQLEDK